MADLHFGYELSQRTAGRLTPMWGMKSTEQRLMELLADYQPRRLLILGDLVHDRAAVEPARALLSRLATICETLLLAGNHDRHVAGTIAMRDSWENEEFHFHHGHCATEAGDRIQVIGHHHPAGTVSDGAGLRLKLPAFVQTAGCWILPAFSPWAAGAAWPTGTSNRVWLCSPGRVLRLPPLVVTETP